ncbi:MAG: UbiD family decarboxylase, partial [Gemmatimonadaceae bacterium]|nr:UbiD family decarboxylase [Gemmatimonadaceae bacterium]
MTDTLDTLQEFIAAIERIGELKRISQPVSVHLEMCEIADRVMKLPGGGPALLFEKPVLRDGSISKYPVAINLYGSMKRMALSLGVEKLDDHGDRITKLLDLKVPEGLLGKLQLLPRLLDISKVPPRMQSGGAACQEIVWQG